MPNANGHGPKTAILYARVSTDEQARSGYSLAQQIEALREYATLEGYEVLEEVTDPGQSGASLERPGMDRVRDLVAAGGVSVVLAQDRDRIAREPAYHYLLRKEFEKHGSTIRALNDRGDDSPEGELTDGILDQLAKFERAKTAERTRRGKLQKARKGKLIRSSRPHYGFKYDETGEGYVVDDEEMIVVRRIFRAVASGTSLRGTKRILELEGVPPPGNGTKPRGRHWSATHLRRIIEDDSYKPHGQEEIAGLVSEGVLADEVAGRLDPPTSYGIFWFNRTRTTRKRASKAGTNGKEYGWTKSTRKNPREQWIAIPVPDAGVEPETVRAAREMVRYNAPPPKSGRRFWEIPGGAVRCGTCGCRMHKYAGMAGGHVYAYYKCSRLVRHGKDACSPDRLRTNHRAEKAEADVWKMISGLMKEPDQLTADLDRAIELERQGTHGDPEREAKAWLDKLAELDQERRGYLRLAAKGLLSDEDLDGELAGLEEARETAQGALDSLHHRRDRAEQLERDKQEVLAYYEATSAEALDSLTPEQRHDFYKIVRLDVLIHPDCSLEIRWAGGEPAFFSSSEPVPS